MEDDKTQEQGSYEGHGPSIIVENEDEEVSSLYFKAQYKQVYSVGRPPSRLG